MTRPHSVLICIWLAIALGGVAAAQEGGIPAENHPWGRFPVGSWKFTRVVAEDLDPLGNVTGTSIHETKTTLVHADASSYTLRNEVTTESYGKRFVNKPQARRYGYNGDTPGQEVTSKKAGDVEVTINGRKIPCEVRQIVIEGEGAKNEVTVSFNRSVSPYVLRKDEVASDGADGPKSTTSVEVLAVAMPYRVLADRRNVAIVRILDKKSDRTTTTFEHTCDDIPGGEVWHSSLVQNAAGKTLRRTTLELLDYSIANEQPDEVWGGRRRVRHRPRARRAEEMQTSPRR